MSKRLTKSIAANKRNAYLTKRALIRATSKAGAQLTNEAMHTKGYIVKAERGWIVKIDNLGRRQKLSRIGQVNSRERLVID